MHWWNINEWIGINSPRYQKGVLRNTVNTVKNFLKVVWSSFKAVLQDVMKFNFPNERGTNYLNCYCYQFNCDKEKAKSLTLKKFQKMRRAFINLIQRMEIIFVREQTSLLRSAVNSVSNFLKVIWPSFGE